MQSLHLHVEDAVGVDLDVVVFEDILCKVLLVLTLDVGKAVENLSVAHISLQVLQFVCAKSSKKYLANAIPKYVDAFENSEGGLFVMQMQLTDPIAIIGPKFYEGTHDENATRFISSLPGKDYFGRVNIIMRDFVGAEKCRQIIALNKDKGTIVNDKLSEFVSKCA